MDAAAIGPWVGDSWVPKTLGNGGVEAQYLGLGPRPGMDVAWAGAKLPKDRSDLARSELAHDLGPWAGWAGLTGRRGL
jgi:hypothetical protein